MDYVVGSVAALITGNVTPNRPKLVRRALTPTKHEPSPNVTPKSELLDDRSIFLSPSVQKKKAIVKKSPKRIFQNPELDITENEESKSPKADKVKKHLKEDLESDEMGHNNKKSPGKKQNKSLNTSLSFETSNVDHSQASIEGSPKKKKKRNSVTNVIEESKLSDLNNSTDIPEGDQSPAKSPKKKKQKNSQANNQNIEEIPESIKTDETDKVTEDITTTNQSNEKNNKKRKKNKNQVANTNDVNKENTSELTEDSEQPKKKKKKNKKNINIQQDINKIESNKSTNKKSKNKLNNKSIQETNPDSNTDDEENKEVSTTANPNAITERDSDSEHDSDNEIDSENEQTNNQLLETEQADESTDEEDTPEPADEEKSQVDTKEKDVNIEEEIKRTLFVGNVPLSKKTRKEIKKIFRPYGEIETIRIRFVPVKDARVTPKLAVIKNELHPERSTVNVYVKFADPASVEKALAENNTVLNGNHLRVTRSGTTGSEHDPHLAVFVGNLPFGIEDEQLRAQFEKCGDIESVRIIRDKKTNAGKGFGYVNFTSKDGVELALNLSEEDLTIKNRIIRVKRCTQTLGRVKKPGTDRSRDNRPGSFNRGKDNNRPGMNRGRDNNRPGMNRGRDNSRPGYINNRDNRPGKLNNMGGNRPGDSNNREDGAHRRVMNKRKFQDNNEEPPNKRQRNINQPSKEKKQRKEFVGMTSEKKKKQKFDKGQKKKKVLSEILMKKKS